MEREAKDGMGSPMEEAARLAAAAALLERTVGSLEEREARFSGDVEKMVAMVEPPKEGSGRAGELERRLMAAEARIAQLEGSAQPVPERKTISAAQLLAKQSVLPVEAGALDAALGCLSLEQRMAVKAELLRAGLVG